MNDATILLFERGFRNTVTGNRAAKKAVFVVAHAYKTDAGATMGTRPVTILNVDLLEQLRVGGCTTVALVALWKSLWHALRRHSGLERFEDFFENVAVGFPVRPGWVNRKDDLFEATDEHFIE